MNVNLYKGEHVKCKAPQAAGCGDVSAPSAVTTWVVMGRPHSIIVTATETVVKKRTNLFRPSRGNSSTNDVTTVSINTIYSRETNVQILLVSI